MNYELAKKLKDAGFPQFHDCHANDTKSPKGSWSCSDLPDNPKGWMQADGTTIEEKQKHCIYHPTLSELIEACGDGFEALCLSNYPKGNKFWQAYPTDEAYKGNCDVDCCGYETGDTTEEAVTNLWIALNNKFE